LCETASARFCKELWARLRVHGSVSVHGLFGLGVGVRSRKLTSVADEVRVWSFDLQTLGDRLDAPTDRAGRLSLCHGVTCVSSWSVPLRRHGHAASPENVSAVQPPLRDLRLVRSGPRVLLGGVSDGGPPPITRRRPPPPSVQP
jgi:hypothetical protein